MDGWLEALRETFRVVWWVVEATLFFRSSSFDSNLEERVRALKLEALRKGEREKGRKGESLGWRFGVAVDAGVLWEREGVAMGDVAGRAIM